MATMETISCQGVDDDSVQKDTMNNFSTIKDDTISPKAEVGLAKYSVKYILQDVPGTSAEKMSISADTQCSFPAEDETKISIAVDATHKDMEGVKDDSRSEHYVKEISHSKKMSISNESLCSSHVDNRTKHSLVEDSIETMKDDKILANAMVEINDEGEVMNDQFDIDKQEEEVTCTSEAADAKQTSDSGSPLGQLNVLADLEQVSDPLVDGTNIKISLDGEDFHSKSSLENAMRFDVHIKDAEYATDKEDEMCDIELSKNIEDTKTSKPCRMVDNKGENVIVVDQNSETKSIHINMECNNTSQTINPVETLQCPGPCTDNIQIKSILTGTSNDTAREIQACLREEEIKRSQQKTNENSSILRAENDVNVEDLHTQCTEPNQFDGIELNKQNLASPVGKLLSDKQDQNSDVCDVNAPQSDGTLQKAEAIGVENDVPINKNCNAVYSESNQCNRDEPHIQKIYSPSEENPLSKQQQQSDANATFALPSMEAGDKLIGVENNVPIDENCHAMYSECNQYNRDEAHKGEISSPPEDNPLSKQQKESDVDLETVLLGITKETKQQDVTMEEAIHMENSSDLSVTSEVEVAKLPTTVFPVNENNEPFLAYSPNVIQNVDAKDFREHEIDVGKYSTVEKPLSNNVADIDSEKHKIDNGEQTKVDNDDHVMKYKQVVESLACNTVDIASQKLGNDDEEKPKGASDLYEMESEYPGDKIYDKTEGEEFFYEAEEDNSVERKTEPCNEMEAFRIGDLVWAKVKSHPWWPAQIFDPSDASKSAMKVRKGGRLLVAFFGDCTFAWLAESQMIPFRSNFEEKVKQTTMKSFSKAVDEALEEVCRRSALALASKCYVRIPFSRSTFPDANAGIQKAPRQSHLDVSSSVLMFKPVKTLEYLKSVACSPFGASNSALDVAELCGHVYGFRTFIVPSEHELDGELLLDSLSGGESHESNQKRRYSSLESTGDTNGGSCETDAEQFPSCHGFAVIKKFKSVEPPKLRDAGVMEIKGHEGMEKVKGTKLDVSNKLNKISKFGDSMKKVAGELTGFLPLAKCAGKSSTKRMKSTSKKHLACVPSLKNISLMQLYEGLDLSARDPLNSSGMSLIQDKVIEAFLRFRKIVFKKSTGYSGEKTKKLIKHPKQGHGVSPKNTTAYPHVSYRNDGADVQELAVVARKRKSEIVQEDVKKKAKTSPTPFSSGKHDFESFINAENHIEPRRFDKDLIKYSRRPAAPSPELKSSVQLHYDEKLSSEMPLGLFMKFPQDFKLPSESELKDKFVSFGPLQSSGTRIDTDSASVLVAFEHGRDAELAWKHAKKNCMFGQVDVNYRLRHISPESPKAETNMDISSFNRDNHLKVVKPTSLFSKEVIQSSSKHSTTTEDRKRTLLLAYKDSNDSVPNEVSNDVTMLQEPTGDIQDQMMTLLRQVSVIVGIPNAT